MTVPTGREMQSVLELTEVERLATIIEEATRSTEEGVKRFVEPAQGALNRATSKRHHIIFGRRGSGKSSLLRKAAADLTVDRKPIAYVDLETFKGHSYPDVLLSVLIESFAKFEEWLRTAAINPAHKTSFWDKLFGTRPKRPALNKAAAETIAEAVHKQIQDLKQQLHSADQVSVAKSTKTGQEKGEQVGMGGQLGFEGISLSGKSSESRKRTKSEETQERFSRSKVDFLHRHILDYQNLFSEITKLSGQDSYLFLDDLYHIQQSDQAKVIDYFHRVAKGKGLWLKIGTIRHRTRWYIHGDPPIGVKLGDDADDIDLDLTLEKYSLAKDFLIKILKGFMDECGINSIDQILTSGAVDRLVLASGGVARDFLGIFRRSINVGRERKMSKIDAENVNTAAGEYDSSKREEFRRDTLDDQSMLESEFQKVRNFCTDEASSNVFLIDKDSGGTGFKLIQELVDLRLLHKVRSRVTVSGRRGRIFEAYMLDVSQYTGARKRRDFEIVEFWRSESTERLRRQSLIYKPSH